MLVLSRKLNQQIRIGDAVQVTVLSVRGSTVTLGITGPPEVPIHREEVYHRITAQLKPTANVPATTPAA